MKLKQIVLALGLAALAAAPAMAADATKPASKAFDRKAYTIPYKKFVLPNGLTLLVHEDHSVPVVGVNVWYHVGSRNEKRGKTGFAHLFEHFFFNGSENYPHGFREAMDDLGANNRNGTTNTDRTNFFEDVPTSAIERTLFLESDRMGFLGNYISQAMLERERGVVQNEKRQGDNQPYGKVRYEFAAKMYPYSHPYSWTTIGSMDDLNAASLEDIREWYRTYYGPNNAVLSLAGDITPERALELVEQVLRRAAARAAAAAYRNLDSEPRPRHPRRDGRPGAAGARVPPLACGRVEGRRRRPPAAAGRRAGRLEERAPGQAPGVREGHRHQRLRRRAGQ
jgi:zinc protease